MDVEVGLLCIDLPIECNPFPNFANIIALNVRIRVRITRISVRIFRQKTRRDIATAKNRAASSRWNYLRNLGEPVSLLLSRSLDRWGEVDHQWRLLPQRIHSLVYPPLRLLCKRDIEMQ